MEQHRRTIWGLILVGMLAIDTFVYVAGTMCNTDGNGVTTCGTIGKTEIAAMVMFALIGVFVGIAATHEW